MGTKTKMCHMNMLKKYIARDPEVDMVLTSNKDDATKAVAGVLYKDIGYHQKEGVQDVKLGEDLSEDQRRMLKDLTQSYPEVMYLQICPEKPM